MKSTEKIICEYLKKAKRNCPARLRKRLDTELKNSLIEFCGNRNSVSYEMLEEHFGKPEQYALNYISLFDTAELNKKIKISGKIKIIVLLAAIAFIMLIFGTMLHMIAWNKATHPQYIYETTEEISNEQVHS